MSGDGAPVITADGRHLRIGLVYSAWHEQVMTGLLAGASGVATIEDERSFPVTEELHRCADRLADAGFVVALVKGENGVYLNAH